MERDLSGLSPHRDVAGEPSLSRRHSGHSISPQSRSRSQDEVVVGLTGKETRKSAAAACIATFAPRLTRINPEYGRIPELPKKTISMRLDGELVTALEGQTVLEAARAHGKLISTLCHLDGLTAVGACTVCVVELAGTDRLLTACTTPVQEGMSIRTVSAKLTLYRKMAVELLLVERNHICSSCVRMDIANCRHWPRRWASPMYRYAYNNPALPVDMTHPRFVLDHNRCILCTRCVPGLRGVRRCQRVGSFSAGIRSRLVERHGTGMGNCA